MNLNQELIGVIGLGYVGLPLAMQFSKKYHVIGFDRNNRRIEELSEGIDKTGEYLMDEHDPNSMPVFTSDIDLLESCTTYIVAVPTPIDDNQDPDLGLLKSATSLVAQKLSKGDLIIFESTVYPGCTEEICVPILENESGLVFNKDFYVGYSPERINPGDRDHDLTSIVKITSGSDRQSAERVDDLYNSIIEAGTYKASSIKVAEAAKVIENTQRDVNIALINELAKIFHELNIDTSEVLNAASTKWNFSPFYPGLVGGHCIGVDPYYLTFKSKKLGIDPKVVLAGRITNDGMGKYVADKVIELMESKGINIQTSKILIFGFSFKPNISDIRNTGVFNVYSRLIESRCSTVDIFDPNVDPAEVLELYDINITKDLRKGVYDAIIIAVPHRIFLENDSEYFRSFGKKNSVIYDLSGILPLSESDGRL